MADHPLNLDGWTAVKTDSQPSGFAATTYRKGDEFVISFRGTDDFGLTADWKYNILGYSTGVFGVQQFADAVNYVESVLSGPTAILLSKISFTGHSLGGRPEQVLNVNNASLNRRLLWS